MYTAFLAVLLLSSLAFTLTSQTGMGANQYTILWTNIYGTPVNQTCYHLLQTSDGGYVLQSSNSSFLYGQPVSTLQALALKTDSSGNLLWTKSLPAGNWRGLGGYGIIQTSDDGLVFGYNVGGIQTVSSDIIKTDHNGNLIRSNSTVYFAANFLSQSIDGGIIYGGYFWISGMVSYPWLSKTDSSGNQIWEKTYTSYNTSSAGSYLSDIAQFNDGGYALFGQSAEPNGLLIKIDSNGSELWHKIYTIFKIFGSSIATNDGGFLVSNGPDLNVAYGLPGLVKLDSSGNIQWNQTYGINISSFIQTDDNGYLVIGGNTLLKLDSLGNSQWSYTFTDSSLSSIIKSNDGNYAISGSYSIGVNTYSWLTKISLTPTPTPTSSPNPTPTVTPTPKPSSTPTPTLSPSPTPSPTASPTHTPSPTTNPTPTTTPTSNPTTTQTPTPTSTPSPTPTLSPNSTPITTSTPILSPTPTATPTFMASPTPTPTITPTTPTPAPSQVVTDTPTLTETESGVSLMYVGEVVAIVAVASIGILLGLTILRKRKKA